MQYVCLDLHNFRGSSREHCCTKEIQFTSWIGEHGLTLSLTKYGFRRGLNKVILGQKCQFNVKDNSRRFSCFPDLRNYFFHPTICLGINCLNLRDYIAALKSLRESMCQLRCDEDPWYYPAEIRQRLTCRNIPHLHRHSIAWHVYYCTLKCLSL